MKEEDRKWEDVYLLDRDSFYLQEADISLTRMELEELSKRFDAEMVRHVCTVVPYDEDILYEMEGGQAEDSQTQTCPEDSSEEGTAPFIEEAAVSYEYANLLDMGVCRLSSGEEISVEEMEEALSIYRSYQLQKRIEKCLEERDCDMSRLSPEAVVGLADSIFEEYNRCRNSYILLPALADYMAEGSFPDYRDQQSMQYEDDKKEKEVFEDGVSGKSDQLSAEIGEDSLPF